MTTEGLYRCRDCGLHYTDRQTADECLCHCTVHHACNLAITSRSVERTTRQPVAEPRSTDGDMAWLAARRVPCPP